MMASARPATASSSLPAEVAEGADDGIDYALRKIRASGVALPNGFILED